MNLSKGVSGDGWTVQRQAVSGGSANLIFYQNWNLDANGRATGQSGSMVSYAAATSSAALPTISQRWSGDRLAARTSDTDRRWEYRYNARGEVESAWQQTGNAVTTPAAGETLAGTGISYVYDAIGNRTGHTEGGRGTSAAVTDPNTGVASSTVTLQDQRTHNYTPNAANQYTQITHPAFFNVKGTRTAGAAIAVNGVAIATPTPTATSGYQTGGTGTIFRAEVPNTAPAGFTGGAVDLYQPVTITQNGTQLTVDDPVQYVAPPTEILTYDADGNLKTDGRWTYTWDAADRLIKMESIAFVQNAVTTPPLLPAVNVSAKVIEFAYDGLSRRIRKKVTEGVSTIAVWEAYVYDGWNMVLSVKLNPAAGASQGRPQSAIASNVWAPDLGSQPFARRDWQKAGGVRGLVLANYFTGANGGGIHVPGMDPMGNVTSVTRLGVSYSAGESPGPYFRSEFVYDYDAFGKETRSSTLVAGLNPDSFPFHFSTKFTDPESGFNYYGYRFYDAANGRWINRDPLKERGGINLYAMLQNNPLNDFDVKGEFGFLGAIIGGVIGGVVGGLTAPAGQGAGGVLRGAVSGFVGGIAGGFFGSPAAGAAVAGAVSSLINSMMSPDPQSAGNVLAKAAGSALAGAAVGAYVDHKLDALGPVAKEILGGLAAGFGAGGLDALLDLLDKADKNKVDPDEDKDGIPQSIDPDDKDKDNPFTQNPLICPLT